MRLIAFAGLFVLASCATDGIRPLRPYEIATSTYRDGDAQSYVGSLMYEDGCLLFRSEDGQTRLLPVWPTGSRFEESLLTFHQPAKAEQRLVTGEEVKIDGLPGHWSDLDQRRFAPFRHQCGSEPFFVTGVTPAN